MVQLYKADIKEPAFRHDTNGHLPRPYERRKCVCHISRHSGVVAVLEGIRGALIQTRAVKSVRASPLSHYHDTSIGSFVHAADELHEEERHRSPRRKRRRDAYGNAVAREKSVYSRRIAQSMAVGGIVGDFQLHDCCASRHVHSWQSFLFRRGEKIFTQMKTNEDKSNGRKRYIMSGELFH